VTDATNATNLTGTSTSNIQTSALASGTANSTTFLRGDRTWSSPSGPPTFEIVNTQIFTTSGTWTKPVGFNATDTVVALVIGAGGSGAAVWGDQTSGTTASGGGGGGVGVFTKSYGDIAGSVAVTVGSGGAAVSRSSLGVALGNAGGASSFDGNSAAGGRGGLGVQVESLISLGGLGGGSQRQPGNATGNNGLTLSGGNGRSGRSDTVTEPILWGLTGGGGGAGYIFNVSTGDINRSQNYPALTGCLYGAGGDGAAVTASAGSAPGGGGGAASRRGSVTSGAGARGEVRIYVVRGSVTGQQLLGVSL
jgi:hypothetical protein